MYCCLLFVFTFMEWCQIPCSQLHGPGNGDSSFRPEALGRLMLFLTMFWSQDLALCSSMQVPGDGKRQSQCSVAAMGGGEQEELLFVKDSLSGKRFLVDSTSQKTLLSPTGSDLSSTGSSPQLMGLLLGY